MTGAAALVRLLEEAGVRVVFGLPGVHNLALWEALRESAIRLVGVRHEQTAAYAADGFSRATGRLGVALVTTGPGAANTLAAVGEARASGSDVLVIATDVPAALKRPGVVRGMLHETSDQRALFAPVCAATFAWPDAGAALAARGTRLLEIPTDALTATGSPVLGVAPRAPAGEDRRTGAELRALVQGSRRPLVWAGGGAVDAGDAVAELAAALGAPILTTYGARGIAAASPLLVGLPPHVPEAGALWDRADLVIAIGSDLDGIDTQNWRQPQPPSLVAVNLDRADASKNYRVDAVLEADAGRCVTLGAAEHREPWCDPAAITRAGRDRLRAEHPDELAFLDAVESVLPRDAVVVADMCIPGYWLAALHRPALPRKLQIPLGWGTLGYGFPAGLGAALAEAGPTVAVCGDGGFLYACGELATVAQERIPLTTVIVDDGGYGMLRFDQERAGRPRFGVDLHGPDFAALGESFGVRAEQVDGVGEAFAAALLEHVADPDPSLLVVRAELTPPPTTSPRWYRAETP